MIHFDDGALSDLERIFGFNPERDAEWAERQIESIRTRDGSWSLSHCHAVGGSGDPVGITTLSAPSRSSRGSSRPDFAQAEAYAEPMPSTFVPVSAATSQRRSIDGWAGLPL